MECLLAYFNLVTLRGYLSVEVSDYRGLTVSHVCIHSCVRMYVYMYSRSVQYTLYSAYCMYIHTNMCHGAEAKVGWIKEYQGITFTM